MEGYISEVRLFAGNFPPLAWAFCNGQLMSIAQNTALFSLIGTTYGGDGQTTFALPDFRGRLGVHTGQGAGLPNVDLGEQAGLPTHTLTSSELPMHVHTASAAGASASTTATPGATVAPGPASLGAGVSNSFGTPNASLAAPAIGIAGGSQPHNNLQPYLGLNFIICVEGIYPSRN